MSIVVGVKRVYPPLYHSGTAVTNWINNPFDEVAVEGALRLRDQDRARRQVTVVSVGAPAQAKQCEDSLRYGLSMGADSALHVVIPNTLSAASSQQQQQQQQKPQQGPSQPLSACLVAQALASVSRRCKANLLMFGQQSPDFSDCQVPQIVAGMLGWNQALFVNSLSCKKATTAATSAMRLYAVCETDHGNETLELGLPAVVSCHTRLATPRIPKLTDVLKARRAKIEKLTLSDLCSYRKGSASSGYRIEKIEKVQEKPRKRRMCKSVKELYEALKADGL